VAPALAEAMRRINSGESVSALFEDPKTADRAAAE
jgi:ribose-phosphate pyrophosphokinase